VKETTVVEQKRRHDRFETDIPVKLSIPGGKGKARFEAFAKLRDVSLGGAFVLSGFRFKHEIEGLEIELFLPTGNLPVKGRVVRQPDGGLGIQFMDLGRKERERLLAHFVPEEHERFYDEVAQDVLPSVDVDRVSLVIHLWEEWKRNGPPTDARSTRPRARTATQKPKRR
jgi:PilZ domain